MYIPTWTNLDIHWQGRICNAACTAIRWVPESPNLFLVSHADGTIIVYDKEREDGAFTPQEPGTSPPSSSPLDAMSTADSQGEWNPLDSIFVTMPPWHPVALGGSVPLGAKPEKEKTAKNPVSHWRVSRRSIVGECHLCMHRFTEVDANMQTSYSLPMLSSWRLFRKTAV